MKKRLMVLVAVSLFAVAAPVLAGGEQHGASHQAMDEKCTKECEMLLRNCAQEVDSIQERIKRLTAEITEKGGDVYTREELEVLHRKLKESNELLRSLKRPR